MTCLSSTIIKTYSTKSKCICTKALRYENLYSVTFTFVAGKSKQLLPFSGTSDAENGERD